MNKIKTNTWILIAVGIVILIIAFKLFSGSSQTTKKIDGEDGAYKIEYYDKNNKLVKTESYSKDGKLTGTVNAFTGIF